MSLAKFWTELNDATIGSPRYWDIAIQNRSIWLELAPIIAAHAAGEILDIGAGRLAWRGALRASAVTYTSADMIRSHPELDVVADLTGELPWPTASFDTLFCCSVLEHLLDFDRALAEMHRILRPGGKLILSVPFLYYRHGDPYDYFRFTGYALKELARRHAFDLLKIESTGGPGEIVINPASIFLNVVWYRLGLSVLISPTTRLLTVLSGWLDRKLDRDHRYATNHIAVMVKRERAEGRSS